MIQLSHLNGKAFYLNAELVQTVESTPDTVITLTSHEKMIVKEPSELVIDRMIEYQRQVRQRPGYQPRPHKGSGG